MGGAGTCGGDGVISDVGFEIYVSVWNPRFSRFRVEG